jgi:hypothetical protein
LIGRFIPISARIYLEGVKFFAEKDPPISTDNEMLSNNIQHFKDGQLTLKSLMIELAQKQFPECLLDFEDYNPDKPYIPCLNIVYFSPPLMMNKRMKTLMNECFF